MNRTLAIDWGLKRVGVAISDQGGRFATPLEVIAVSDPDLAIAPILQIVQREAVQRIVIGLPLDMDGTVGGSARNVMQWADKIRSQTTVQLIFIDERLSSFDAEQILNDRKRAGEKLTRKRRKEQLDAVAAAQILQAFLDGKIRAIEIH